MTQNYQENPVYAAEIGGKQVNFITLKEEAVNAQYLQEDFPNAQLVVLSHDTAAKAEPHLISSYARELWGGRLGGLPRWSRFLLQPR